MHDIVCRATTYELSTLDYTGVGSVKTVAAQSDREYDDVHWISAVSRSVVFASQS